MLVTVGIVTQQEHLLVPHYRTRLVSSPYEGDKFRAENVLTLFEGFLYDDTYPLVLWRCSFLEGTQSPAEGLVECLHSPSRDELLKTATRKIPLKNYVQSRSLL